VTSSDQELAERVAAGDDAALRLLVDRYHGPLSRYATSLCGDAVQETFVALWQHAGDRREDGPVRPWLFAIARNATRRLFRRERPESAEPEVVERLGEQAGWGNTAQLSSLERGLEDRDQVRAALAGLADVDREILALVEIEGLTLDEAASALSLSLAALKSRLHRARLRFMAAVGVGGSDAG
jgi:RNA polymerase sigma-70 factor, ECF subfamily